MKPLLTDIVLSSAYSYHNNGNIAGTLHV